MRRLAILVLGFSLAAACAHAQEHASTYGTFGPNMSPPKHFGGGTFTQPKPPEPYRAHAPRDFAPIQSLAPPKPIGPQTFKPFKGTSTYDGPGAFKPYKPPKMKSVYDH